MTGFSTLAKPSFVPGKAFGDAFVLFEDFGAPVVDSAATAVDLLGWAVLPAGASAATGTGHGGEITITQATGETWISSDGVMVVPAANRMIYCEWRVKYSALTSRLRIGLNTIAVPSGSTSKAIFDFGTSGTVSAIVYNGATSSQASIATAAVDTYYTLGIQIHGLTKTDFFFDASKVATIKATPTAGTAIGPVASIITGGTMTVDYVGVLADR